MLVSVFEIPQEEYPAFVKREDFFKLLPVEVCEIASTDGLAWPDSVPVRCLCDLDWRNSTTTFVSFQERGKTTGMLCASFANDNDLIASNFQNRVDDFVAQHERIYKGPIYRDDILPCRVYLLHCLVASERLHPSVHANFLGTTVLGDRKTTLKQYLDRHPQFFADVKLGQFDRYQG